MTSGKPPEVIYIIIKYYIYFSSKSIRKSDFSAIFCDVGCLSIPYTLLRETSITFLFSCSY